jgi:hypothetical protein
MANGTNRVRAAAKAVRISGINTVRAAAKVAAATERAAAKIPEATVAAAPKVARANGINVAKVARANGNNGANKARDAAIPIRGNMANGAKQQRPAKDAHERNKGSSKGSSKGRQSRRSGKQHSAKITESVIRTAPHSKPRPPNRSEDELSLYSEKLELELELLPPPPPPPLPLPEQLPIICLLKVTVPLSSVAYATMMAPSLYGILIGAPTTIVPLF